MKNKQRLATAGVLAGLAAGSVGGFALAVPAITVAQDAGGQDAGTATEPSADSATDRQAEHENRMLEALQPLIDDGTITQAQADAVISALAEAGPGFGPHGGRGPGPGLDAAATAIGVSADELRQALDDGSTIADVAASHGMDVQAVVDAMLADLQAHLSEEVANGEHTQAEADEKLAGATERITAMVNGEAPTGPPRAGNGS